MKLVANLRMKPPTEANLGCNYNNAAAKKPRENVVNEFFLSFASFSSSAIYVYGDIVDISIDFSETPRALLKKICEGYSGMDLQCSTDTGNELVGKNILKIEAKVFSSEDVFPLLSVFFDEPNFGKSISVSLPDSHSGTVEIVVCFGDNPPQGLIKKVCDLTSIVGMSLTHGKSALDESEEGSNSITFDTLQEVAGTNSDEVEVAPETEIEGGSPVNVAEDVNFEDSKESKSSNSNAESGLKSAGNASVEVEKEASDVLVLNEDVEEETPNVPIQDVADEEAVSDVTVQSEDVEETTPDALVQIAVVEEAVSDVTVQDENVEEAAPDAPVQNVDIKGPVEGTPENAVGEDKTRGSESIPTVPAHSKAKRFAFMNELAEKASSYSELVNLIADYMNFEKVDTHEAFRVFLLNLPDIEGFSKFVPRRFLRTEYDAVQSKLREKKVINTTNCSAFAFYNAIKGYSDYPFRSGDGG